MFFDMPFQENVKTRFLNFEKKTRKIRILLRLPSLLALTFHKHTHTHTHTQSHTYTKLYTLRYIPDSISNYESLQHIGK